MRCEEVREVLPAYSRDGDVGLPVRRHLSRCEECTLELDRYQSLAASLGSLRAATVEPPPQLFHQLAAIPYRSSRVEDVRSHVARHRNGYAVAGVAVAAAGALGAAVWRSRRARTATA
jgi:anti-sigma factor RsiW